MHLCRPFHVSHTPIQRFGASSCEGQSPKRSLNSFIGKIPTFSSADLAGIPENPERQQDPTSESIGSGGQGYIT
jgi:hypothetical protein